jgi:type II secretory pathway component GspD/PulD (secretin)
VKLEDGRGPLAAWAWALALVVLSEAAVRAQAPPEGQVPPTVPLTQLDVRGASADLDNHTFSLTFAQPLPIKELLLLLVRGTSLSVVPDPSIEGSFIGELKNVTVRQALDSILPSLGLDYRILDGGFIRVFKRQPETRLFDVNYIVTQRSGTSTIGSAEAAVSTTTRTDLFGDLARGVRSLLSDHATFSLDRTAGVLQVTDFPERLDRVAEYLDTVHDRVHRQVALDARIVQVELNDSKASGIDWSAINAGLADGQPRPTGRSLTGLRVADQARLLAALAKQGTVTTIDSPRLVSLNNEPAILRSNNITVSITPQIAADGTVMLDLAPIVRTPGASDTAALPRIAESDTLARVADGETLVVAGFGRDRQIRERQNLGRRGGWFGRSTVVTRKRVELVILLTPRIL